MSLLGAGYESEGEDEPAPPVLGEASPNSEADPSDLALLKKRKVGVK